jgi:hypothetical protein
MDTVLTAINLREKRRTELQAALARLDRQTTTPAPEPTGLRACVDALLRDWRGLAAKQVQPTRQLLRKLLVGRITFMPESSDVVRFRARARWPRSSVA